MDLYSNKFIHDKLPERLNVVGSVRPSREVRQVELDLVPALVQSHGHCADEWFDSGRALHSLDLDCLPGSLKP